MNDNFSPGNIFMLDLDFSILTLEYKRRPYLIISCDVERCNSSVVTVLPLRTRKNAKNKWIWEYCLNYHGRKSAIICDKIITIPRYILSLKSSEWNGTISDEALEGVKKLIKYRLRLK